MALFPMTNVTVLGPLQKEISTNAFAVQSDNKMYKRGLETASPVDREITNLGLQFGPNEYSAIMTFLQTYRAELNQFVTPGYAPFNRTTTSNYGYILGWERPRRVADYRYEIVITILWRPDP